MISLFSGAGGLDLGFQSAGFSTSVALDIKAAAIKTHHRNFPESLSLVGDLIKLQPQGVVDIVRKRLSPGSRIGVVGWPPCQGFSRANVNSSTDDPRNKLPTLYLEIVEAFQEHYVVEFIVFENVLGIQDKKHVATYDALQAGIQQLGFVVTAPVSSEYPKSVSGSLWQGYVKDRVMEPSLHNPASEPNVLHNCHKYH